ncbi:hypothetical protein BDN70DRAFT_887811 [Pholiota conissans]|uniref:Uncharacterized protein n=1 Tax=Pholiota conissans TaxID=109636 RepID=A0A9P6CLY0_9AGAR|nr:hypothetical protein BDN70DRAFT_887811 [Pholiota conissans]
MSISTTSTSTHSPPLDLPTLLPHLLARARTRLIATALPFSISASPSSSPSTSAPSTTTKTTTTPITTTPTTTTPTTTIPPLTWSQFTRNPAFATPQALIHSLRLMGIVHALIEDDVMFLYESAADGGKDEKDEEGGFWGAHKAKRSELEKVVDLEPDDARRARWGRLLEFVDPT